MSVAPTLIAEGAEFGDPLHALHPVMLSSVVSCVVCDVMECDGM